MFSPNCPNPARRPYLHWPPPPPDEGKERLVAETDEDYAIRAEAWRRLGEQIHPTCESPPAESRRTRIRRQLLEPVMACAGAVLGWFAPLLVKQVVPGAGATLYECAEDVLCPLFAFVGGGIGITCGNAWAALRQRGGQSRP